VEAETAARLGRKARENRIAIVDFPLDGIADLDRVLHPGRSPE
jgi:hypothetical protein